ncbi:MAG: hypothetical protein MZV65_19260 [Chromatiales bacterium]|nr:hypothetical protein [Chromatiales bacterium]
MAQCSGAAAAAQALHRQADAGAHAVDGTGQPADLVAAAAPRRSSSPAARG